MEDHKEDKPTMTVAELIVELQRLKPNAKVLIHLSGGGRVVEGVLPDAPPDHGIGNDFLNVVYLYGDLTHEYPDEETD